MVLLRSNKWNYHILEETSVDSHKTALHARHKHNLPTYVAFIDLFKKFDTVSHSMMLKILEQYGAPPKLRHTIARMYADLKIVLKIRKSKAEMVQKMGVRQGDRITPVLFIFDNGVCRNAWDQFETIGSQDDHI